MFRRLALKIGLFAALPFVMAAAPVRAQTNIDQGKSPAEIFATDCATCHKTTRGLASGHNSWTLSSFLREHYTASREQAAAVAAYVLSAGGSQPAPRQKPGTEPKTAEPKAGEPKIAAHPEEAKPEEHASPARADKQEAQPITANQVDQPEETARPALPAAPVAAAPAAEAPNPDLKPTTSAAVPAQSQPDENGPVPRDNIPD